MQVPIRSKSCKKKSNLVFLICGPAGGGKTTLVDGVLAKHANDVRRAITCTTRAPRLANAKTGEMEKDGVHYYFLDPDIFLTKSNKGEFLETAHVHGHNYGTLKSEVADHNQSGKHVLLNVDVQGATQIRGFAQGSLQFKKSLVQIFIAAPVNVLAMRLKNRGSDSLESIALRLANAKVEIAESRHFDYIIESTTPEADLFRFQQIMDAELMRSFRNPIVV